MINDIAGVLTPGCSGNGVSDIMVPSIAEPVIAKSFPAGLPL